MRIDIKEINKIELKENELLWITIEESAFISEEAFNYFYNNLLNVLPESWLGRVIIGS